MKKAIILFFVLQFVNFLGLAQVKVQNLLVENLKNPIGLDIKQPRFSWQLTSSKRNTSQSSYEIRVGLNRSDLSKGQDLLWTSGKVKSDSSILVAYKGKGLESGKRYYWQVRVQDNDGKVSPWSEVASWQTALLNKSDWTAKWIVPGYKEDTVNRPSPLFRKEFNSSKKVASATAYITAHGMYEAHINGKRVGDAYFTPGWTSYNKRLQYQVYDVTDLLKEGNNAIGVTLANGWYRGYIAFSHTRNKYGNDIALLFQLEVRYTDGSSDIIISDKSWKSGTGPILYSELYHGEIYDAQKEKRGWMMPGYNDKGWSGVNEQEYSKDVLVATYNEPIRKQERIKPVKILKTPKGEHVIDFGQNLVGWIEMKATGKPGTKITLSHAEVLDKDGNFYTENLRSAKAQDVFILKGGSQETFEPHFTWHGFQYIKVENYPGELKPEDFTAVVLYSDMPQTGSFTSSNPLINKLQENILWGQKGNFLDVPTDCPQRDERLGWTGDAQVFARTASFNMNVHNFFTKWMKDVEADQLPNGSVPFVVPNVLGDDASGSTGWADAATVIPWTMYQAYGDKRILSEQYSSMKAWVNYMRANSKDNLWRTGFHFGDWLFFRPWDDNDGRAAVTDKYLIAACFYAHSTQILINTAEVLGNKEDVETYTKLLKDIKDAFVKEYVTPNGRLVSGTQTAYVLALNFDMLPDDLRQSSAQRLVENIASYDNHLTTGFLGTPYLCHVLSRFGYTDVAYKLLMQETYPSWLYPVKMGATTIWERWDGIKPDKTFQTPSMNSYNHYAYGAIGDWMYRTITGIEEDAPGYKKIVIKPHIGGGLTQANAKLQSYYGLISSSWKQENRKLALNVDVPANTTAEVYLPAASPDSVLEGGKQLNAVKEIKLKGKEGDYVVVGLGSGSYQFTIENKGGMETAAAGR